MGRQFIEGNPDNNPGSPENYKQITATESGAKNRLDVAIESVSLASRIDDVSTSLSYIGKAPPATADAAAAWQIFRISVSGAVTSITWADGDSAFDNVWNNRASLVYS